MATVKVFNKNCVLEEGKTFLLRKLDDELSFDVSGAQFTRAYRGYVDQNGQFVRWDGKQRLLNEDLSFPRGLLQRVIDFYARYEEELVVEDLSTKSVGEPIDILPQLNKIKKSPYPYQLAAVEAIDKNNCGILRMATGSGKTVTMALMTAHLGKTTMIYVIGKDLLYQIHKLFQSLFKEEIGIIGDGLCTIHRINVVSIWTVGQALGLGKSEITLDSVEHEKIDPQKYKDIKVAMQAAQVHIFDECHSAANRTVQEISKNINPEHIYGMSASPWRDDGADMLIECVLGRYLIELSASDLIEAGYLVRPIIKFQKVPKYKGKEKKAYKTIYSEYIVHNDERNGLVVKATRSLVSLGYQTLVLYNSINHGELLRDEISKFLPCVLLSGKDDNETRNKVKEQLESGKIRCVIASKIFDIGVDLPSLSGLVIASSGKSSVRALQRIGRVIRKYGPEKKNAAVVDFVDQAPFLRSHSKERLKIYSSEPSFEVHWPESK